MKTLNVLSTNYDIYLTKQKTLSAAKDCIKHFGQGEKVRFELYVYATRQDIENRNPAIHKNLMFKDPWLKNKQTLVEILEDIHHFNKNIRFQIFGTLYLDD